jgi:hypothetical protein
MHRRFYSLAVTLVLVFAAPAAADVPPHPLDQPPTPDYIVTVEEGTSVQFPPGAPPPTPFDTPPQPQAATQATSRRAKSSKRKKHRRLAQRRRLR